MGFFPCMKIRLERTGDSLIAEWYDNPMGEWIKKEFERGKVGDALAWLETAFTAVEM